MVLFSFLVLIYVLLGIRKGVTNSKSLITRTELLVFCLCLLALFTAGLLLTLFFTGGL
jgi:ABC-type microcin C transport system permease subunit YejB